jgi:hypothetical protein
MNKYLTAAAAAVPLALGVAAHVAGGTSRSTSSHGGRATRSATVTAGPLPSDAAIGRLVRGEEVTVLRPSRQRVRRSNGSTGWVDAGALRSTSTPDVGSPDASAEAVINPACPAEGTHKVQSRSEPYDVSSDAGLRNEAKRHIPASGPATKLALADFAALQQSVDSRFADASVSKTQFEPTRDALHDIQIASKKVGEGDRVQFVAFVTIARNEHAESVNCGGEDGADIHISLGDGANNEYTGIVAEMIPQLPRPIGWDSATLMAIHDRKLQVLVVGGLTYDNEHLVNANASSPKKGQPARMSLWELHPIVEFYVCASANPCDPDIQDQWVTLTDWANAHSP